MKGDAKLLREIRQMVVSTPARGDKEKLEVMGLLRERLVTGCHVIPCPQCGNPIDIGEAGTHIRTGYRSPCPKPYLPGSWYAEHKDDDA